MEIKIGVILPQAKECQEPPEAEIDEHFSPVYFQRSAVLPTPYFWTSGLQNYEKLIYMILRHSICDNLL